MNDFERDLTWARRHMPLTQAQARALPDLRGARVAFSIHLELKSCLAVEAVLERGGAVCLAPCNPHTVRDEVVQYLTARGAQAHAWQGMDSAGQAEAVARALAWGPTHLSEMGADLSAAIAESGRPAAVRAGLEATGSGIARLAQRPPPYPIFNWDDLPIKEGLHNRYMVGLSTWQTFAERTRLSLHRRHVLVVGFGLVGQGVASAARAFGGTVSVAERDPARLLEARYQGYEAGSLADLLPRADVIVTATSAARVLRAEHFAQLKDGCFLVNVGHASDEIDVAALGPRREALPFVEEAVVNGRTIYLFAGGSMANLTAGQGDSLNAFDLTLAAMMAGLRFILSPAAEAFPPGLHPLPREVWQPVAELAAR